MSGHPAGIRAILLDIEGTTTPIAFVTEVLFPYARRHLRSYLEQRAGPAGDEALLALLREEHARESNAGDAPPPWIEQPAAGRLTAAASYVEWLMDRDRKSPALKELQGRIWEDGYRRGELLGDVFPDVPAALERWRSRRIGVGIFSSGSVLAQQLLFRHSSRGDLTPWLDWYFDTGIGAKTDPATFRRIANTIELPAEAMLFLSDVTRELEAAHDAGMQARLSVRPGNAAQPANRGYEAFYSFDQVE